MVRLRVSWPFSLSSAPTVGNPCRPLQPESVSNRRESDRSPDGRSPFSARPMLVDADDGSGDQRVLEIRVSGQNPEKAGEDVLLHPPPEPLEDRVPVPEHLRKVPPGSPDARDPEHRFEKPAIVRR